MSPDDHAPEREATPPPAAAGALACGDARPRIVDLVGLLADSAEDLEPVRAHVLACDACAAEAARLTLALDLLAEDAPAAPDDVWARLEAEVGQALVADAAHTAPLGAGAAPGAQPGEAAEGGAAEVDPVRGARQAAADSRPSGVWRPDLDLVPASDLGPVEPDDDRERGPAQLGPWLLLGPLGHGGMGVVHRARHVTTGREVALKVLRPGAARPERIERFLAEAELAGRLRHPGVVAVHEVGWHEGAPYYTMDLVQGESLAATLARRERLPLARVLELVAATADAVQHAHDRGVVHRDLKPGNVLLDRDGRPRVTDFGLALAAERAGGPSSPAGTPHYMAPEQLRADATLDGRVDVWALGVLLYELLTLAPPFVAGTLSELAARIDAEDPAPPSKLDPRAGPDVDAIVLAALAKSPAARTATPAALARDLRRALRGEPVDARAPAAASTVAPGAAGGGGAAGAGAPGVGPFAVRRGGRPRLGPAGKAIAGAAALACGLAAAAALTGRSAPIGPAAPAFDPALQALEQAVRSGRAALGERAPVQLAQAARQLEQALDALDPEDAPGAGARVARRRDAAALRARLLLERTVLEPDPTAARAAAEAALAAAREPRTPPEARRATALEVSAWARSHGALDLAVAGAEAAVAAAAGAEDPEADLALGLAQVARATGPGAGARLLGPALLASFARGEAAPTGEARPAPRGGGDVDPARDDPLATALADDGPLARAARQAATAGPALLALAAGRLSRGDLAAAAAALRARAAAGHVDAPGACVEAALALARGEDALDAAEAACALAPGAPEGLRARAAARLARGEEEPAARDLEAVVARSPDDAEAALALADLLDARGDEPSARAILERLTRAPVARSRAHGRAALARLALRRAEPIAVGLEAWLARARARQAEGPWASAHDPAPARDGLARGAGAPGEGAGAAKARAEAQALLEAALAEGPREPRVLAAQARFERLRGAAAAARVTIDEALAALAAAPSPLPTGPSLLLPEAACVLLELAAVDEAIELAAASPAQARGPAREAARARTDAALDRAAALAPGAPAILAERARRGVARGAAPEAAARDALDRAEPPESPRLRLELARALEGGDPDPPAGPGSRVRAAALEGATVASLLRAVDADRCDARSWSALALVAGAAGRRDLARLALERAAWAEPWRAERHLALGEALVARADALAAGEPGADLGADDRARLALAARDAFEAARLAAEAEARRAGASASSGAPAVVAAGRGVARCARHLGGTWSREVVRRLLAEQLQAAPGEPERPPPAGALDTGPPPFAVERLRVVVELARLAAQEGGDPEALRLVADHGPGLVRAVLAGARAWTSASGPPAQGRHDHALLRASAAAAAARLCLAPELVRAGVVPEAEARAALRGALLARVGHRAALRPLDGFEDLARAAALDDRLDAGIGRSLMQLIAPHEGPPAARAPTREVVAAIDRLVPAAADRAWILAFVRAALSRAPDADLPAIEQARAELARRASPTGEARLWVEARLERAAGHLEQAAARVEAGLGPAGSSRTSALLAFELAAVRAQLAAAPGAPSHVREGAAEAVARARALDGVERWALALGEVELLRLLAR